MHLGARSELSTCCPPAAWDACCAEMVTTWQQAHHRACQGRGVSLDPIHSAKNRHHHAGEHNQRNNAPRTVGGCAPHTASRCGRPWRCGSGLKPCNIWGMAVHSVSYEPNAASSADSTSGRCQLFPVACRRRGHHHVCRAHAHGSVMAVDQAQAAQPGSPGGRPGVLCGPRAACSCS